MLEKGMLVKVIKKGLLGYGKTGIVLFCSYFNNTYTGYQLLFKNGIINYDYHYKDELLVLNEEPLTLPIDNSNNPVCNWCCVECKKTIIKNYSVYYCPKCLR